MYREQFTPWSPDKVALDIDEIVALADIMGSPIDNLLIAYEFSHLITCDILEEMMRT